MPRTPCRLALLFAVLLCSGRIASAQVATGTPPFGSFGGRPDVIDLANLNAHIDIPVLKKAGRGTGFTYDLSYDSSVWYPVVSGSTTSWQPVLNWGWRGATEVSTGYQSVTETTTTCYSSGHIPSGFKTVYSNWTYHDTFGVLHVFPGTSQIEGGTCGSTIINMNAVASDSSGFTLQTANGAGSVAIISAGGRFTNPPFATTTGAATATDRNGNQINVNSSGQFFDTLNSTVPVLAVAGSGSSTSPITFTYTAPTGATPAYIMNFTNYTVATSFGVPGITEYKSSAAVPLVTSIVLPDASQYTFTYETTPGTCTPYAGTTCVTSRIKSLTLPTGGTIMYVYSGGSNGVFSDGSAATLTRTTPDGSWTYAQAKGIGAASTTTITDSLNNQTVIEFQGIYEVQRQIYSGSAGSGTLIETLNVCFNGNTTNCNATAITLPITGRALTLTFPGGLQSKTNILLNGFGSPTEYDEYDYGIGTPGPLLRKTLTSYASLSNGIVAAPASVTIQDGSGNTKSQISYGYDQTSVTATSGTPQHVAVSGSRGNVTTVSRLIQGTTNLSRTATYYDTGNILSLIDTNGASTTANYSSTGSCGNSFVTSLTMPLGLSRSAVWNCTGGVITSVTDENGQVATTAYSDTEFWRSAAFTDALSNATNISYTGSTVAESVLLFNGNQSTEDVLRTLDGLGRLKLSQRRQAPASLNFDTTETDYDALGRPYRTTIPYVGTAGQTNSSAPASVSLYDSLGRLTQTTDGGGGVLTKTYSQNDVLRVLSPAPTGENTKRKQLEFDGLGRLTSVCEITGAVGSGACAQTSSQTGYWTRYSYDAVGDLTGVVQNAQSSTTQSRSFVFDMLGRMTSETNPETGTTTYAFDSASGCTGVSQGDLIKKMDAVGNTICYLYDTLHRVTSITYSGPYAANTPNRYFVYDSATVNSVVMTKAKTRLAEAYTATCSTCSKITDVGYSYSGRGDRTDVYEATPHSGGYYHINSTYWPNREIDQMSGLAGLPTVTYGVDGEGRGNSVSASTGQNPVQSTSYNVFDEPTSVGFGSGDSDSFAYDPSTGRVTQYNFAVNGLSVVGTLGWNKDRTLSTLGITDPFNSSNTQNCSYSFDDLKRLASSNCGSPWSQTFNYDPFGNITMSGTGTFQPTYSSTTNRFTSLPGFTPVYDANGNLMSDSAHTYSWNADGRPVTIDSVSITYDALSRMIEQNRASAYTQVVYAPNGGKLALMNGQTLAKGFVSLPSGATAVYTSSGLAYYRHADWLDSSRLSSTPTKTIYSDSAYSPFGQSYVQSGTVDVAFTGQNQDTVPGLYDFPAREYAPLQGRWISPDPSGILSANPVNPKTWNRYAYAMNNPLSMVDPNGECSQPAGLQPGQVGVCVDLFIASPVIGNFVLISGEGDGRGPDSNSGADSFRVEYSIVYDPQAAMVGGVGATVTVTTDPSHVDINMGPDSMTLSSTGDTTGSVVPTENPDGSVTVSIDTSSINGFSFVPFSPAAIETSMSITMSPDSFTSIDAGGERSAFPSMEVWTYSDGQDPFNLLFLPETTPAALGSLNQSIPNVSNDPSKAQSFTGGADESDDGGDGGAGGDMGDTGDDDSNYGYYVAFMPPLCNISIPTDCTEASRWASFDGLDRTHIYGRSTKANASRIFVEQNEHPNSLRP
jgi:RHS repeat-associated protein